MKERFKLLQISRENVIKVLDKCSLEQLNKIPDGYNNNLIWNAAHVLVTQQLLIYRLSKNEVVIDEDLVDKYKKGNKAEGEVTQAEVDQIKSLLRSTALRLEEDYNKGLLKEYYNYQTSYGYEIPTVEDAISFNNTHEGLHLGYMMAMLKNV